MANCPIEIFIELHTLRFGSMIKISSFFCSFTAVIQMIFFLDSEIDTFSSVRSRDIRPKLRPEKRAEKHKQQQIMMTATQIGTTKSNDFRDNQFSVPWCMNGWARSIFYLNTDN